MIYNIYKKIKTNTIVMSLRNYANVIYSVPTLWKKQK